MLGGMIVEKKKTPAEIPFNKVWFYTVYSRAAPNMNEFAYIQRAISEAFAKAKRQERK